jgi:hypothetical protein
VELSRDKSTVLSAVDGDGGLNARAIQPILLLAVLRLPGHGTGFCVLGQDAVDFNRQVGLVGPGQRPLEARMAMPSQRRQTPRPSNLFDKFEGFEPTYMLDRKTFAAD